MNKLKQLLYKFAVKHTKLKNPELTYGLNSDVSGSFQSWSDYHVLMIDYDDRLSLKLLIHEIKYLQEKYHLAHCHIVESSPKKYHAFFFNDVLDYFECCRIIHEANCCQFFKKQRMLFDHITIRMSPKTYGHFQKPRVVHIEMNYPKNISYNFLPENVKDNARQLQKLYLSNVEYDEVLRNG